ncbi:MAG: AbrB/MazE/SpoVT family DNA-binding domain-containing protein [Candidatus Sumerlaeota bacterium]|nr:AbrB/MazE/SpoVT family DNA-binding domain-containing protein [Candidatus Sumerlaeota bacterium]
MPVATISSKGQITLPVSLRRKLGFKPHDRVSVESENGAIVIKPVVDFFSFRGVLGKAGSLEAEKRAMMRAVADHVLGKRR